MGGLVLDQVREATRAYTEWEEEGALRVIEREREVNAYDKTLEGEQLLLIARRALELGNTFRHRDNGAQVTGNRRAARDQQQLLTVEGFVVSVYLTLALDNAHSALFFPFGIGTRGFANLVEHETAHLNEAYVQGG